MKTKEQKLVTKKALKQLRRIDSAWVWSRELREARMDNREKEFVIQQWALAYGSEPPADVDWILLEVKLGYQIEYDEKKLAGTPMSKKFMRNYKAAMNFDLQGFDADMKYLLELGMKYRGTSPEKEQEMKVKRQAAAKKAQATKASKETNKGPKKGATWVELFSANYKKQLTDADLAKEMTKRMNDGHVYTEQEVVKNRGFFNFGGFGAKYPKPKTPLQQFKNEQDAKVPTKAEKKSKK